MAQFLYTTSLSVAGPWLIDSDRLNALDDLLEEEWKCLTKRREEMLEAEVEENLKKSLNDPFSEFREKKPTRSELQARKQKIEESLLQYGRYKTNREIIIYLRKDKKVKVTSFKEAMRQQTLL